MDLKSLYRDRAAAMEDLAKAEKWVQGCLDDVLFYDDLIAKAKAKGKGKDKAMKADEGQGSSSSHGSAKPSMAPEVYDAKAAAPVKGAAMKVMKPVHKHAAKTMPKAKAAAPVKAAAVMKAKAATPAKRPRQPAGPPPKAVILAEYNG